MNTIDKVYSILETISDPEIPVLSILDLGVVRDVKQMDQNLIVSITPTYSACPAMHFIEQQIMLVLSKELDLNIQVETVLSPAWTTDWLSDQTKQKLREYGIAAPMHSSKINKLLNVNDLTVHCPRCESTNTVKISEFGSTACKALYKCKDCLEPFDYFKCI